MVNCAVSFSFLVFFIAVFSFIAIFISSCFIAVSPCALVRVSHMLYPHTLLIVKSFCVRRICAFLFLLFPSHNSASAPLVSAPFVLLNYVYIFLSPEQCKQ